MTNTVRPGHRLPNGFIAIATKPAPRHGAKAVVVLAVRPAPHVEYATWIAAENDASTTTWGHYKQDIEAAVADMNERSG